ncbi:MAG TPA: hypothetical protein VNB22_10700 [Pyrinomonadaceae bacterium]|nr:hypothetical protein [Pyrinomonadaceae bacterium]
MNRRYFWLIPEFTRFRIVFETAETVLGVNGDNEHRLFRKDTGKISFDEREALRLSIVKLTDFDETEDFLIEQSRAVYV